MTDWADNRTECTTTWVTLCALNQMDETFPTAGAKTMDSLLFWSQGSADMLKLRASALAAQLDKSYTRFWKAVYETDVTTPQAIKDLTATLLDKANTVSELAKVANGSYRFLDE